MPKREGLLSLIRVFAELTCSLTGGAVEIARAVGGFKGS